MAEMQQCPFCREVVSGRARNCSNCGESLAPPTRASVLDELDNLGQVPLDELDDLTLAYLRGADLGGAHLVSADLSGADLSGANLFGADLSWTELQGADLQGADLRRADLTGTSLQGVNLVEALYDEYTRWPGGYDPVPSGAVCADRKRSWL